MRGEEIYPGFSFSYITALSLLESFIVLLRQLSYAIKNQLGHPKPPTRGFGTPNFLFLGFREVLFIYIVKVQPEGQKKQ